MSLPHYAETVMRHSTLITALRSKRYQNDPEYRKAVDVALAALATDGSREEAKDERRSE